MSSQSIIQPKWHSPKEVAEMLGYGLSKVKLLIAQREIKSIKDGKYRRILPEWVDEYVQRKAAQAESHIDDWELAA